MSREIYIKIKDNNTSSSIDKKVKRKDLKCPICPPNRGCNHKGLMRSDKYKNKR